ncbi:MAG: glycosyltransferase family 2 protein [Clostridiaceae bacterium]|nr:glycosyltransferase family 2 protein [Clostridiaceae bacterium]
MVDMTKHNDCPLVSIIVPMYKVEEYIEQCMYSLLGQTYENIEVLAISDGSPDRCADICRKLAQKDKRLTLIETNNNGVSSARNEGIIRAKGNYLMFVDGDDWVELNMVEVMLHRIINSETEVCFCNQYYRNDEKVVNATAIPDTLKLSSHQLIEQHLKFQFIASSCFMMIDTLIIKDSYFDEQIHTLEDWEFNFRVLTKVRNATILAYPFYHYRIVVGSTSKSPLNEKKMSCFLIPEKVEKYAKEHNLPYGGYGRQITVHLLYHLLVILANNDYVNKEADKLKYIARRVLPKIITDKRIVMKKRFYVFITAITPKLFRILYKIKYLRRR